MPKPPKIGQSIANVESNPTSKKTRPSHPQHNQTRNDSHPTSQNIASSHEPPLSQTLPHEQYNTNSPQLKTQPSDRIHRATQATERAYPLSTVSQERNSPPTSDRIHRATQATERAYPLSTISQERNSPPTSDRIHRATQATERAFPSGSSKERITSPRNSIQPRISAPHQTHLLGSATQASDYRQQKSPNDFSQNFDQDYFNDNPKSSSKTDEHKSSSHGTALVPHSSQKFKRTEHASKMQKAVRLLADGLVVSPSIIRRDVSEILLKTPSVVEKKRFCWKCKKPIARTYLGTQNELVGNCPYCHTAYSFIPSLDKGTILADQYAILGAFAYGGLGWLYLATDKNVSNRLVVLKGLLSIHDSEAHEVALAERQFLAEVEHPGIVRIFNFVEHTSFDGTTIGYIVMEFFPGKTLYEVQKEYDIKYANPRLPLELAIGYILEVLPALTYLHSMDLVYNDLKPENIMVSDDGTKLIDLGSVSAINAYGRIYGTPGFQAPDIIENGPSPQSDIYTVGRTLASLILGPNLYKEYPDSLPTPDVEPIFQENDSLYRLLLKATEPLAENRFDSAEQLRIELFSVLREILSRVTHRPHADISRLFSPQRGAFGVNEILRDLPEIFLYKAIEAHFTADDVYASLPTAIVDPQDPASPSIRAALSQSDPNIAVESLRNLELNDPQIAEISAEYHFAMIRLLLDSGDLSLAKNYLLDLPKPLTKTWQYEWLMGLFTLLTHNFEDSFEHFFRVYEILPGEIAPRLAAASAGELYIRQKDKSILRTVDRITLKQEKKSRWSLFKRNEAVLPQHSLSKLNSSSKIEAWSEKVAKLYEPIWIMDHSQISAVMGYARMKAIGGKIDQAVDLLDTVPLTSRYYLIAKASAAMLLIYNRPLEELNENVLRYAAVRVQSLPETDQNRLLLRALLFTEALNWLISLENSYTDQITPNTTLLGYDFSEDGMRLAAEESYRQLARLAPQFTRYHLVDLANSIRPRTKF